MTALWRGLAIVGLLTGLVLGATASSVAQEDPANTTMEQPAEIAPAADMGEPVEVNPDATGEMGGEGQATPTPTLTPTPTFTPSPTATATVTPTPTPPPTTLVQQAIQGSIDAQVQAIATRNVSLVADTSTDEYARQLTALLLQLLDQNKVTKIALVRLDWGPVTFAPDGRSANATTFETWQFVTAEGGSVDYAPARNDYALVLDNGRWKIQTDTIVVQPQT